MGAEFFVWPKDRAPKYRQPSAIEPCQNQAVPKKRPEPKIRHPMGAEFFVRLKNPGRKYRPPNPAPDLTTNLHFMGGCMGKKQPTEKSGTDPVPNFLSRWLFRMSKTGCRISCRFFFHAYFPVIMLQKNSARNSAKKSAPQNRTPITKSAPQKFGTPGVPIFFGSRT